MLQSALPQTTRRTPHPQTRTHLPPQELARAEASSRKLLVAGEDGALEIDGAQLQVLRQIVHAGMARKARAPGAPGGGSPDGDPPPHAPPSRWGPP